MIQVYIDGSSNGIDSCICIIIKGGNIRKGLRKQVFTYEKKNIQFVEYEALIKALKFITENSFSNKEEKTIYTDSLQVYKEVNTLKPCSYLTLKLLREVLELLKQIPNINVKKINRRNNPAGFYLEKRLNILKNRFRR